MKTSAPISSCEKQQELKIFKRTWTVDFRFLLVIWLLVGFCYAQTQRGAEVPITKALEGRILVLKTPFLNDDLHFDSQGKIVGNSDVGPWTTHGWIKVSDVRLSDHELVLKANRVILVVGSVNHKASLVSLVSDEKLRVSADLSDSKEAEQWLTQVFESSMQDRVDKYWTPRANLAQSFDALNGMLPDGIVGILEGNRPVYVLGKKSSIKAPQAITTPDPKYPDAESLAHPSGVNVVRAVVNEQGFPEVFQLIVSEKGLDESALIAVSKWRFHPATKDGNPVAVLLNVQMNFQ